MNGVIAWFAKNAVAANILMVTILILGIHTLFTRSILEVFPEIESDIITINVQYRGSTPLESEEGVVIKIEEALYDLSGIEEMTARAMEGSATVSVKVLDGYNPREMLDDIKNRVDTINTFPVETERPIYSLAQQRREVISVVVSGDVSEHDIHMISEKVRDEIAALEGVTQVELTEVRPYEISIEIPHNTLQKYNLSFAQISEAIKNSSIDLPSGAIKTTGGEISLRTKGQAYSKTDFENIVIIRHEDGRKLTLGQIANIDDGFEEEPLAAMFNNKLCTVIDVYRVGKQNAIELADTVRHYVETVSLPPGIEITYWRDRSVIIKNRLNTLLKNALQGGILVFIVLALFLRVTVALWVCAGIPVSFTGALFLLPELGVTINIMSLFAFILVLGIVVDDAIVTGENIYTHLKNSKDSTKSAIEGTQEVAVPVIFGVLTTVAAFIPLMLMGGRRGPIFAQIPLVIIPVLLFSLMESKLILPSHLKHMKIKSIEDGNFLLKFQRKVSDGLEFFIFHFYKPLLGLTMKYRYITLSVFASIIILTYSIVASGIVRFVFFPRVQSEIARASLIMPQGTPFDITFRYSKLIADAAQKLKEKYIIKEDGESVIQNILVTTGSSEGGSGQSHIGKVEFEIVPPEKRTLKVTSTELVNEWRQIIGPIPGAKELNFRAEIGRTSSPIDIQLAGKNFVQMKNLAEELKKHLSKFDGVFDITDSFEDSKEEILLSLKKEADHMNISRLDLAGQIRQAFFGLEVQRIQRGKDDVRVMLRYPDANRSSIDNLETMMVKNSAGEWVPFKHVATASLGKGVSTINRVNRNRTINVTADVDKQTINMVQVNQDINTFLENAIESYPGVQYSFEGEAKEQRESFGSLIVGIIFVLLAIYSLLAIPFKSYLQPFIVMSVIPFGLVGAVLGHMLLGYDLSILSFFGMLALSGVIVNDSLVLVDYVNKRRIEGTPLMEAVQKSGAARFRPILLTSLTTFAGLTPLIFEKSTQAQFLIPMAISLGYGVMFATFITLFLVPINYLVLEDGNNLLLQLKTRFFK